MIESDRIVFIELECLDQRQLLFYEGSASAGKGFEHLADLQADAVLTGQADRLEVDVVDRAGEVPKLFVGANRQRGDLRHATTLAESIYLLWQLDLRDLQSAAAQAADRSYERPADPERNDECGQHRNEDDRGVAQSRGLQCVGTSMHRALEIRRKSLHHSVILVDARAQRWRVGVAPSVESLAERRAFTRRRQLGETIDRRRFRACGFRHLCLQDDG